MNKITDRDILRFSFYGNLKCRKDWVVFVRGIADEQEDCWNYDLMGYHQDRLIPLTNRRHVSSFIFAGDDALYLTVPAKAEKKEDGRMETQILSLPLDGGEAQLAAQVPLPGASLCAMLDESRVLLTCTRPIDEESVQPDYEVLEETPWYINARSFVSRRRTHLYVYDLNSGELQDLITDPYMDVSRAIVHEGMVYFLGSSFERIRCLDSSNLYALDWKNGALEKLVDETRFEKGGIYTLDAMGDKLFFFASDGRPIGMNSNPWLYSFDLKNKTLQLEMEWGEALGNSVGTDCALVGGNAVCVEKDAVFFTSTIVSHNNLFCVQNRQLHQLLEWPGTIHSFGYAQGQLYFIGAAPNELQQLYTLQDGKVIRLSDFNAFMKEKSVSEAKPVFYKGYDGNEQMGWILYPADFDPDHKYPGILDIHGGPKTVYGTVFYHEMQMWASHGYFVFFCNPFGSDGQGNAYADLRGRYGTWDYQDLMAFTDQVLALTPQIDSARLFVTGGSYGGFMTNWIIGHTDRFAGAASQRSISNWISFCGTSDIGPDFTRDQQGCGLENIEQLWEHSPLKYADNVKTPTLFIHSDEDYRCPLEQGQQMLNALLTRNVPARLVMFRGENHELSRSGKPSHRLRRLNEITEWMDHLNG